jgi:hypothetical protein
MWWVSGEVWIYLIEAVTIAFNRIRLGAVGGFEN